MSRDSITLSKLLTEYDLWAEVSPCTKAAVGVAVRSLHRFLVWVYGQEHHTVPPADANASLGPVVGNWGTRIRTLTK
jgi:hypothetical protein